MSILFMLGLISKIVLHNDFITPSPKLIVPPIMTLLPQMVIYKLMLLMIALVSKILNIFHF